MQALKSIQLAILVLVLLLVVILVSGSGIMRYYRNRIPPGATTPELIVLLEGDHQWEKALNALIERGDNPDVVPALREVADDSYNRLAVRAYFVLYRLGDDPDWRYYMLMEFAASGRPGIEVFSLFGPDDSHRARDLTGLLSDMVPVHSRSIVIDALSNMPAEPLALNSIIAQTENDDAAIRIAAARALGKIVENDPSLTQNPEVIQALCNLLDDPDVDVRWQARTSLRIHGSNGNTVAALIEVIEGSQDGRDRAHAFTVLADIAGQDVVMSIAENATGDSEALVRSKGYEYISEARSSVIGAVMLALLVAGLAWRGVIALMQGRRGTTD